MGTWVVQSSSFAGGCSAYLGHTHHFSHVQAYLWCTFPEAELPGACAFTMHLAGDILVLIGVVQSTLRGPQNSPFKKKMKQNHKNQKTITRGLRLPYRHFFLQLCWVTFTSGKGVYILSDPFPCQPVCFYLRHLVLFQRPWVTVGKSTGHTSAFIGPWFHITESHSLLLECSLFSRHGGY